MARQGVLISYWSEYPDPKRDLKYMFEKYGEGIGWEELEPGYLHIRKDRQVVLRCSALPAISVEIADYLQAKSDLSERAD